MDRPRSEGIRTVRRLLGTPNKKWCRDGHGILADDLAVATAAEIAPFVQGERALPDRERPDGV